MTRMSLRHSLTNVDGHELVGDCSICGPKVRVKKSRSPKGNEKQPYRCYHKYYVTKTHIESPWKFHKKDYCEKCNFTAEHECQLTVDHIDGNRYNNEISNWQTLCHNCHALKSWLNQDHFNRYSAVLDD
jgi:hypothetical protein